VVVSSLSNVVDAAVARGNCTNKEEVISFPSILLLLLVLVVQSSSKEQQVLVSIFQLLASEEQHDLSGSELSSCEMEMLDGAAVLLWHGSFFTGD
jgi:hypothetical protein